MTQPRLTIDLSAVAANWHALDLQSGAAETGSAVKADGYGCGVAQIAGALSGAGCKTFFVATLEEGIALRASLKHATIFVLNGIADADEAAAACEHSLSPCLNHLGQIEVWRLAGGKACALQLDSGMSRLGLPPVELERVPPGLDVRLVLSHLSCADEPDHHSNEVQRARFLKSADILSDVAPNARLSLAATGGTLIGPDYHFDLVRCGIGLYGGHPFEASQRVVSLDAPILQVRDIPQGQSVGYGWSWTASRPARIGTLPLGYADGISRALSNGARLFFGGKPIDLVGRVSMDLITVDLTDHPEAQVGAWVEILGANQTIDALAQAGGTIGYELLTSLGHRYARRYTGANQSDRGSL